MVSGSPARPSAFGFKAKRDLTVREQAEHLGAKLPPLMVEAERVAATVAQGAHGRRRVGVGETFWQFRRFRDEDSSSVVDWRQSGKSQHLFVREREWEAAHTVWLWPDLSPSMDFASHLSTTTKRDRALVLMLAAAELLVRGGERVGLLGLGRPTASRKAADKLAETLLLNTNARELTESLPPEIRLPRFTGAILFSDFLDPAEDIVRRIEAIAGAGVSGHLVQVLDPAEETLPYEGRAEFLGLEGGERWIADRAESLRDRYQAKLQAHRQTLTQACQRLGWTFLVHHTDRAASEPLLALVMRLSGQARGTAGDYRFAATGALGTPETTP